MPKLVLLAIVVAAARWLLGSDPSPSSDGGPTVARLTVLLGALFLGAALAGALARDLGLPRFMGHFGIGLVLGPDLFGLVSAADAARLSIVDPVALGLLALATGSLLSVAELRRRVRSFGGSAALAKGLVLALGTSVLAGVAVVLITVILGAHLAERALAPYLAAAAAAGFTARNAAPAVAAKFVAALGQATLPVVALFLALVGARIDLGELGLGGLLLGLLTLAVAWFVGAVGRVPLSFARAGSVKDAGAGVPWKSSRRKETR